MVLLKRVQLYVNILSRKHSSFTFLTVRRVHNKKPNTYVTRTHTCGEVTTENVNQLVTVCGWLHYQRMNQFAILRDAYGTLQAYIPEERKDLKNVLSETPLESVVQITGKVHTRPKQQINKNMATGEVEVLVDELKIINSVEKSLPFSIRDYNKASETTRMKYRYLDLRFPIMQRNIRFRSDLLMKMREFLINHAFVEVETPTLFKKTPGGAQEFIVPTHFPGEFYSLVQSPQQLKQLLMVGGIDRYFQVARCYRDEGARPDRQPEFTQLDIEISFSDAQGVMSLIEDLLVYCWPTHSHGKLKTPFQRMTYKDALNVYGTDQPSFISKFPIIDVNSVDPKRVVKAVIIPNGNQHITSSFRKECEQLNKRYFNDVKFYALKYTNEDHWKNIWTKCNINLSDTKLMENNINENDMVLVTVGPELNALKFLGKVRVMCINKFKENHTNEDNNPIWIVDFPLFEMGDKDDTITTVHHPFTSPHPEDVHLLYENPLKVRGLHYDLVLNGYEIAGGSVRIHNAELQSHILTDILKLPTADLQHLLEGLASGAPPHAGIAFGIDRLIAILVGAHSIRDVIAFPKSVEGRDHLTGAPSQVSQEDLDLYRISINHPLKKDYTQSFG